MKIIKKKKGAGFTLMELVVSMAVFIVVISIVLGLFSSALRGQRKTIALQNVQDNARFLLDFVAKELRMSQITGGNGFYNTLSIVRSDDQQITYMFDGANIQRIITGDASRSGPLNSSEISVNGMFYISGVGKDDSQQPKVTIIMRLETEGMQTEEKSSINLQTTLSQRNVDF